MTPEQMLAILHRQGEDAGSDFNDSDAVNGWFGWTISEPAAPNLTPLLTVTLDDGDDNKINHSWYLVPVSEEGRRS